MSQKIGIAVIHGAGIQKEDFAEILITRLKDELIEEANKDKYDLCIDDFAFIPIYWATIFNDREKELWESLNNGGQLDFSTLRKFIIEFLGDAIAYQPTSDQFQNYERVHEVYFHALKRLNEQVGDQAPLVVIGHSLGTVITSNFFYDLQKDKEQLPYVRKWLRDATPLMKGETLSAFISLGSPLALWSLRYFDFNKPIQVPSKQFRISYPNAHGGWWNIFDKDDVLGYPLKSLNKAYEQAVVEDLEFNTGNLLTSWTPLSHFQYVKDGNTVRFIVDRLLELHRSVQ